MLKTEETLWLRLKEGELQCAGWQLELCLLALPAKVRLTPKVQLWCVNAFLALGLGMFPCWPGLIVFCG